MWKHYKNEIADNITNGRRNELDAHGTRLVKQINKVDFVDEPRKQWLLHYIHNFSGTQKI